MAKAANLNRMQSPLQELLARHEVLLQDHLKLCSQIYDKYHVDSVESQTIETCRLEVEKMIQNFSKLSQLYRTVKQEQSNGTESSSGQTASKRKSPELETEPASVLPSRKRQRAEESTTQADKDVTAQCFDDPSGFFTIDTNPTPIDELMAEASISTDNPQKRKRPRQGANDIRVEGGSNSKKQSKTQSSNETNPGNPTINEDDHDQAFLAKVASKQAQKEARRQRKTEKKRKRASNGSLDDHASGNIRPTKKQRASVSSEKAGQGKKQRQKPGQSKASRDPKSKGQPKS